MTLALIYVHSHTVKNINNNINISFFPLKVTTVPYKHINTL